MSKYWFVLGVAATFGFPAASAMADMVVQCNIVTTPKFYHVEQERMYRSACPGGTLVFDRSTCTMDRVHAPAGDVFAAVQAVYDRQLADQRQRADALKIRISRTTARIQQFFSEAPADIDTSGLVRDLRRVEAERAEIIVSRADTREQVARIHAAMVSNPDPDLAEQLTILTTTLHDLQERLSQLDSLIAALQGELVAAYSTLHSDDDFLELVRSRDHDESALSQTNRRMGRMLRSQATSRRMQRRLLETFFTWEILRYCGTGTDLGAFASRLEYTFEDVLQGGQRDAD